MKCPNCNREIPNEAKFCLHCGTKIVEDSAIECPKCHNMIPPDSKFCPDCGVKIENEELPPVDDAIIECPECKSNDVTDDGTDFMQYCCNECGHVWGQYQGIVECPECGSVDVFNDGTDVLPYRCNSCGCYFEDESVEDNDELQSCPECGSRDVVDDGSNYLQYECNNCGHIWGNCDDDDAEGSTDYEDDVDEHGAQSADYKNSSNVHQWVDLGLPSGLKWATCNIGASAPEDFGTYIAWGEYGAQTKNSYSEESYRFSSVFSFLTSKYNHHEDKLSRLEPEDDAARRNWGKGWRIPTKSDFSELLKNCSFTISIINGVKCMKCKSKINGNSIYLPAAGSINTDKFDVGENGNYWSADLHDMDPHSAWFLEFDEEELKMQAALRCLGKSIRPVFE